MVIPRQVPNYLELIDTTFEFTDAYATSYQLPVDRLIQMAWLDVVEGGRSFFLFRDARNAIATRLQ